MAEHGNTSCHQAGYGGNIFGVQLGSSSLAFLKTVVSLFAQQMPWDG
jgi:hypothetical protein